MHPIVKSNQGLYGERFKADYASVFHDRIEKVAGLLEGMEGKLLDIGCGDGSLTKQIIARSSLEPYGVELVPRNVLKAKRCGLKVARCDLLYDRIPFREKFDVVFAGEIIEHLIDTEKLLRKMKGLCKKDGMVVVSVPNLAAWYNRGLLLLGFLPFWVESGSEASHGTPYGEINGHVRAFTKKSFGEILEKSGFRVERMIGTAIDARPKFGSGVKASIGWYCDKMFSYWPAMSTSIIAVCRVK